MDHEVVKTEFAFVDDDEDCSFMTSFVDGEEEDTGGIEDGSTSDLRSSSNFTEDDNNVAQNYASMNDVRVDATLPGQPINILFGAGGWDRGSPYTEVALDERPQKQFVDETPRFGGSRLSEPSFQTCENSHSYFIGLLTYFSNLSAHQTLRKSLGTTLIWARTPRFYTRLPDTPTLLPLCYISSLLGDNLCTC